jgi:nanoRNase/pAp phosphatase (c-di-AMP/oligoRNAs hydrolase)
LNRFRINTGDTEGIVNYPLSIKNIIFSTFISERDNEIRMSFRSKGEFNVNISLPEIILMEEGITMLQVVVLIVSLS